MTATSDATRPRGAEDDSATATSAVHLRALTKSYGDVAAVAGIDLEIADGEFFSMLGPSGSGKTTTLRMIAGFELPTAGRVLLHGRDVTRLAPFERDVNTVFQDYALFPHMTVAQNVAYPLTVRKVSKTEQASKVEKALSMVRLQGLGERFPSQLSGGQQQRVALARALVFEPQLVLMDEPLGALDKQLREHMQIELKELHRQLGVTFVFVTHDQGEALTMSDRVAVFNSGVIQQIDAADRMYEAPANRFVAGFIGDGTLLTGTLRAVQPGGQCDMALPDGRVLSGVNVNAAAVGAPVVAGIRPERIVVHTAAAPGRANVLQAQVRQIIYFGDHLRLLCHVGEGQSDATVKLPLSSAAVPKPGDALWLELPHELTRVYV